MKERVRSAKCLVLSAAIAALGLTVSAAVPADATGTPIGVASAIGDVMVIDISGGASATAYPVSYFCSVDMGIFNCDAYKNTKIVLRRIESNPEGYYCQPCATEYPITQKMPVAKDYWIGLFQVTAAQYARVMGEEETSAITPKHTIGYNTVRGTSTETASPTDASFLGRLVSKCGINGFDFPTEAQWEIACRANAQTKFSCGDTLSADYAIFNYDGTQPYTSVQDVGTKLPNAWGLYDMHGNLCEWCRDRMNSSYRATTAENFCTSGNDARMKVRRGGAYDRVADSCTASVRNQRWADDPAPNLGFRLCCTPDGRAVPADATGTPLGAASAIGDAVVIDISGGASAASYPVHHYFDVDMGCFNCDVYKTTKIVLRKVRKGIAYPVDPKKQSGGDYSTEKTIVPQKDYWIGLFETTAAQYDRVMGVASPSTATTPKNNICYSTLRGNSNPTAAVSGSSFMKLLIDRTGISGFDLPTEVQWEIAARAGSKTNYGEFLDASGNAVEGCYEDVAPNYGNTVEFIWYEKHNTSEDYPTVGVKPVGLLRPNLWGLYDTAGNLLELCRDILGATSWTDAETPYSSGTTTERVRCGGWYNHPADACRPSKHSNFPYGTNDGGNGFRLCCVPSYVVTLDAQGGTGGTESVMATYGAAMPTVTVPTKAGYTFLGYFDANGKKYYTANGTSAANWDKTEATTLYALWKRVSYFDPMTGAIVPVDDYTTVSADTAEIGGGNWYVVGSDVSRASINVSGTAYLIVCDGVTLTLTGGNGLAGLQVNKGNTLYIYGQEESSGKLKLTGGGGAPGLGSAKQTNCGKIVVNGCRVWSDNDGSCVSTGIGVSGGSESEEIILNGGTLDAGDGYSSASIGVWIERGVEINGGSLYAKNGIHVHEGVTEGHNSFDAPVYCVTTATGLSDDTPCTVTGLGGLFANTKVYPQGGNLYFYLPNGSYAYAVGDNGYTATVNNEDVAATFVGVVALVTLDAQGGEGGTESVTAIPTVAMPTITVPAKDGYKFLGYFDANGKKYYNADGSSAANWDKTAAATLYAIWTANTYTVTLDANGGEGGTASVTATYNAAMPTATMPTKTGFAFLGYFDANGKKYYNADGTGAANWDKTENTTLYAQWAAPGEEGNPWSVGGDVVAYTNGTGGLVISGTGAAGNFSKQNPAPWAAFADKIRSVTIADGVTQIGSRFFKGCTHLGTVTGGKDLVSVGENAFYQCMSLETISLDNAAVLDSLKNAIVYQTAIDKDGKPYVIPFIDIPGYANVLYGTVDLANPVWEKVPEGTKMEESGYHFFKYVLENE